MPLLDFNTFITITGIFVAIAAGGIWVGFGMSRDESIKDLREILNEEGYELGQNLSDE